MTRTATPLRVIYGGHGPGGCVLARVFPWIGTPMTVAGTSMPRASPPPQAWPLQPRNRSRSVPLTPRQGDLRHVDIATVEDTLRSVHWDVDNCPSRDGAERACRR